MKTIYPGDSGLISRIALATGVRYESVVNYIQGRLISGWAKRKLEDAFNALRLRVPKLTA